MKCELKYVVNEKIKLYKSTTLKELLVLIPIATLIVLFFGWLIGIDYTILMIIIIYVILTCLSFKDAIKYCKNRK